MEDQEDDESKDKAMRKLDQAWITTTKVVSHGKTGQTRGLVVHSSWRRQIRLSESWATASKKVKQKVRVCRLVEQSRLGRTCELEGNFQSRSGEKGGLGGQFGSQRLGSLLTGRRATDAGSWLVKRLGKRKLHANAIKKVNNMSKNCSLRKVDRVKVRVLRAGKAGMRCWIHVTKEQTPMRIK